MEKKAGKTNFLLEVLMVGFNRKNFKLANVNGLNDPKEITKTDKHWNIQNKVRIKNINDHKLLGIVLFLQIGEFRRNGYILGSIQPILRKLCLKKKGVINVLPNRVYK